ncbi:MAG TPA: L,D-transpeptidase family protein [Acidimicrobiales bacterium]|nr:L,D-transpeptidase family protein [Acidimicrobiales bacterium]
MTAIRSKASGPGGTGSGRGRAIRPLVVVIVVVGLLVVGVGVAAIVTKGSPIRAAASPTSIAKGTPAADANQPLTLVSSTPTDTATGIPSDASISLQFSAPVNPASPQPTLTPAVAGTWQLLTPTTYTFVATTPFVPTSTETVTIPGGIASTSGKTLGTDTSVHFTVADGTILRLQQLLATLGYLPLTFTPARPLAAPQEAAQAQEGVFAWKGNEPASLTSLWTEGTGNTITTGAVMYFQNKENMKTDGVAGPAVWAALLSDVGAGTVSTAPYDYVYVSTTIPESTTVYSNGNVVYTSPANTGVPGAETASGTFPVYLRYTTTTMSGTNLDGSKYSDPGIPWVSYFNGGDALHGFIRSSYGTPQSLGCVEMPYANAAVVYPLTPIGTLVTVG